MSYDAREQDEVIRVFSGMLWNATKDGGRKRAAGTKPPWYVDDAHEAAIWSHVNKWKHGETQDKDSGAHPLVHLAWRALAIAYQETYGRVPPSEACVEAEEDGPSGGLVLGCAFVVGLYAVLGLAALAWRWWPR